MIACWWHAVDLCNLCPELHLISEMRKIVDWLQFSWKSMCNRTVMQACHMTLVQQPWWCCTWSYQLFLTWLLRQRRITFFSSLQPFCFSLHTFGLARYVSCDCHTMILSGKVVVTSLKSLFTHHINILDMYNETGFIWYVWCSWCLSYC